MAFLRTAYTVGQLIKQLETAKNTVGPDAPVVVTGTYFMKDLSCVRAVQVTKEENGEGYSEGLEGAVQVVCLES
ncbi:MAG: hypothetical protein QNJ16_19160 [Rhodobacter sp.]|nr:hypothetical protein [Rhodobacter sp.]